MENDEKSFGDKKTGEDEILDFEFDELAKDSAGAENVEAQEDEGIIELVDVVEKGEAVPLSETEEIERYLDKEESLGDFETGEPEGEAPEGEPGTEELVDSEALEPIEDIELDLIEAEDTLAISDVEEEPKEGDEDPNLGLDLESALETLESSEESETILAPPLTASLEEGDVTDLEESDLLLEEADEEEETMPLDSEMQLPDEEEVMPLDSEMQLPNEEEEAIPLDSEMQLPDEDLSAIPEESEESSDDLVSSQEIGLEAATSISEEKMEAIVTRVVDEAVRDSVEAIVERVARETMTTVAEKLITEAIQALRESLDSSSE